MEPQNLEAIGIIAFDGITKNALHLHPDEKHILYPMGLKVAIKNIETGKQRFLSGHTNNVSTLCVSPCGEYIASGQNNHLGFKAMVIVWNYKEGTIKSSYETHKVSVVDLCFTSNSDFLVSLGGKDDGNLIIWDVRKSSLICGSFASNDISGDAYNIARTHLHDKCFVTSGDRTLKIWWIETEKRKMHGIDMEVGKLKRIINCIAVDERDEIVYCGTSSGDIIKARSHRTYICSVYYLIKIYLLIVVLCFIFHQAENVCSAVMSMILYMNEFVLIGTSWCEIYQIQLSNFHMRLLITSHTSCIYSIAFPRNHSKIFATGSKNDIRLWQLEKQKEIIRITVANFVCSSLQFACNDQVLFSAWNDGIIRAFRPHNGEFYFSIHNAHTKAVSTIAVTSDDTKLISGGCDGQVRIWDIKCNVRRLISILKEHRGPITSLHISSNNENLISSSTDGTCVIWDITRCIRKYILMGNTMFMTAQFTPDGIQILTCGTDRKIAYWETLDGSLVREIEGSSIGTMNCVDISSDGQYFVTGSNDCTVKIWEYDNADLIYIGTSHAAIITACKFSADGNYIVTASADGAIMIWKCPSVKDFKFADEKASGPAHSLPSGDRNKLSSQKAENEEGVIVNRTVQSSKTSTSSCLNDQKLLSAVSDQSKGSKKEIHEERISVCKCASLSSMNSKLSTCIPKCRCKDKKSDGSSNKAKTPEKPKEFSDSDNKKFITSKT
ncbi:cilia- and flagella-associated protein 52 [Pogonomyrmex barbatus]|uniref:Cilia- and flagella-associated protein 52 n=1 Tax=Pogonomyrmex barbatus TaxID=144034 RepID=A0A6I9WNJ5_9HYME|nr:cilia- and flagella-associated protein 52 [Pogonomyrmex barbatus]